MLGVAVCLPACSFIASHAEDATSLAPTRVNVIVINFDPVLKGRNNLNSMKR